MARDVARSVDVGQVSEPWRNQMALPITGNLLKGHTSSIPIHRDLS